MKVILALFITSILTACAMHGTVLPKSEGERAATYSVDLRIALAGADALLVAGTLTPAAALQLADAALAANASLRLYYDMSDCEAAQTVVEKLPGEKNATVMQAVKLACDQFNGKPFDQVAQLELAKSALTVLSQTLHSAGSK